MPGAYGLRAFFSLSLACFLFFSLSLYVVAAFPLCACLRACAQRAYGPADRGCLPTGHTAILFDVGPHFFFAAVYVAVVFLRRFFLVIRFGSGGSKVFWFIAHFCFVLLAAAVCHRIRLTGFREAVSAYQLKITLPTGCSMVFPGLWPVGVRK